MVHPVSASLTFTSVCLYILCIVRLWERCGHFMAYLLVFLPYFTQLYRMEYWRCERMRAHAYNGLESWHGMWLIWVVSYHIVQPSFYVKIYCRCTRCIIQWLRDCCLCFAHRNTTLRTLSTMGQQEGMGSNIASAWNFPHGKLTHSYFIQSTIFCMHTNFPCLRSPPPS